MERGSKRASTLADRELGIRIRAARIAAHFSQVEVGQILGMSSHQVQKYENGSNRISALRFKVLVDLLGTSVKILLAKESGGLSLP